MSRARCLCAMSVCCSSALMHRCDMMIIYGELVLIQCPRALPLRHLRYIPLTSFDLVTSGLGCDNHDSIGCLHIMLSIHGVLRRSTTEL